VKHEVILVTTEEERENHLLAVVYQTSANSQIEKLATSIKATAMPVSWDVSGGPGSIEVFGRALVVSQTRQVHEQIAIAFKKFVRPVPMGTVAFPMRELLQQAEIDFLEKPLNDVLDELQEKYKLAIGIDKNELADAGIRADVPVTISVAGVSLRSAIELILRRTDLSLARTNDKKRLIVTTEESAEMKLIRIVYNVQDLAITGKFSPLIEVLMVSLVPYSWDVSGGPATLRAGPAAGTLAISQTVQVHLEIDRLLKNLRQLGR